MSIVKWFIIIIALLAKGVVIGQHTISGKVTEQGTGESLGYASVAIKNSTIGATTNQDGYFVLYNVPSDTATIQASYVGYAIEELKLSSITIKAPVVFELEPLSALLQEVVVSADAYKVLKANSGISEATLSTKQLTSLPSIGEVDIFRSLQLLPGISSTNESSAGLYVRGGTPEQNLVMLDGITVYKVDHFFGFFSAFNAKAVKDVKIYKSAYPAKYGSRISSVVDMNLKTGSFEKFGASAGGNLFAFNAMIEGPIGNDVAFMVAGRRSFNDVINSKWFKGLRNNLLGENEFSDVQQTNNLTVNELLPDFYFYDLNSKLSYRPTEKDMITMSYYGGKDFLDESRHLKAKIPISNDIADNRNLDIDIKSNTNWGNDGVSLKWSRQWSDQFYSNLVVATSQYFSQYERDASLYLTIPAADSVIGGGTLKTFEDNKVNDQSIRFDLEWKPNGTHSIETGFMYVNTNIDYVNIRDDSVSVLERHEQAVNTAIFLSDTWTISSRLNIIPGIRLAYYDLTNDFFITPRFSAIFRFTDRIKFKAAYGKYYQYVNRIVNDNISEGSRDFWLLADGKEVPVSYAHHYVAGVSYETDGWLFDMEVYHKDLSGLSEFTLRYRTAGTLNPEELFFSGTGRADGVEYLVQKKSGPYTGWIAYTLGWIRNTFEDFNEARPFPALHDQLHEIKMVQSIDIKEWTLASTIIYGSGRAYSKPSGQYSIELLDGRTLNYIGIGDKNAFRLMPYARVDISAYYSVIRGKSKLDFGFSIFNLLNRRNTSYYQYDFQQDPTVVTEVKYIGITPNLSFNITF